MSRLRWFVAAHGLDLLIVAAALAGALGAALRPEPQQPSGALAGLEVVVVALVVLALLARHRWPFAVPASTWLLCAALSVVDGQLIVANAGISIAGMIAAFQLGNLRRLRQARLGLTIVVAGAMVVVGNDPTHTTGDLLFIPVLFAMGWVVGYALHERVEEKDAAEQRAARAERERDLAARVAVAEERSRIARELHDVVAHAVSVMVLQVGAVRHRMPRDDREDRQALLNVEQAGRTALAEMRRLLDAMRRDDEAPELVPHPGLGEVDALLDEVRAAGLDVALHRGGEPFDLSAALDLSAYRIVQEGLTNVLKHSGARHAEVDLHYDAAGLRIAVRDDGRGPVDHPDAGHGLLGIGERVKIYGGELTAGPGDGGGFVLSARLPVGGVDR